MDKTTILYQLTDVLDLESTPDIEVYNQLKPYTHNATKTAFTQFLKSINYRRISARRNNKIIKIYRLFDAPTPTRQTCPICHGNGFVIKV